MVLIIVQALYFMLPAYVANMAPVLFCWVPWGEAPLDHGYVWHGKRVLGDHKTYRGMVAGLACAVGVVFFQSFLENKTPLFDQISLVEYDSLSPLQLVALGILFGIGALGGDCIKSFFKRRIGIAPGRNWIPFDQLDFVIGALFATSLIYTPPLPHLLAILVISPFLHVIINIIGYFIGPVHTYFFKWLSRNMP